METGILVGLIVFFLGIVIGLPLCWVFLASSISMLTLLNSSLSFMAGTYYHALNSYILMAIAFFILAGSLMASAGLAEKLVLFSHVIVGKIKGGMIAVGIVATLFLSALTGSSVPCISALIPLLVGPLEKYGYERRYTTAVLCSSSFLGYLIPPSVPVLIYCLIAHQSVAAVFLSTVIPGLLLAGGYMLLNYFICDKYMHAPTEEIHDMTKKEKVKAIWGALPALGCPVIVLVGIYGGICTPNEAGALAVIYTLLIGLWVYRKLDRESIWQSTRSALISLGMVFVLIAFGTVFARVLTREGVAQLMATSVIGLFQNKLLILLMINVLLLVLGMFIDGIPILIVVVPLILPLITNIDMNLVHLGAVIVLNIGIGVITPPYAISIFVGSRLSGVSYDKLVKPMSLFLFIVAIPVLLLTTYIPALSCWLPTLILGSKVVGSW
ncbi:MAG: TRAP transporter large permease [Candidatus Atribacteria bacterium]|nr:TRAP transporter large permease [Candidatus Atribacteria bacterium]